MFLEKIYSASTKSSEGLKAVNLICRTERKEREIYICIPLLPGICLFRRRVIYYVERRGELHETVFSGKKGDE